MAVFYPELDLIPNLRQKPTEGELHILNFLNNVLSDEYEVFFQPYLNGDMPDIIIMRENSGVYIIEVKDWDLSLYSLGEKDNWYVNKGGNDLQIIQSPISQVFRYKQNLYNLHIEGLLEKRIKNPKMLAIVNCGVYFHNSTTEECNSLARENYEDIEIRQRENKYLKFLNYFDLFGRDSLNEGFFRLLMKRRRMNYRSWLFTDNLYKSFKRLLKPPTHVTESGKAIVYTASQKKLLNSSAGSKQKAKGVAGSGKTMCLAKRAVNAHKRHGDNVLILTFNIALRNYIKDKISEVREDFSWEHFHIIHYHEFFKSQANNYGKKIYGLEAWKDENFFESVKGKIRRYKTIIIDEVQDYDEPWIKIILKYFLSDGGEYVVFGDEKQNIYQIVYDDEDKKPYTKIGGQWNILKESFRISNDIARLAENFQKEFFTDRYELDEITVQRDIFDQSTMRYLILDKFDDGLILEKYKKVVNELDVHDNDVCFQASSVECLRSLDYTLRNHFRQKTNTMFETQEVYDKLHEKAGLNNIKDSRSRKLVMVDFKKEIEKVRRNKKFNFWNNPGVVKLSTIHSFKGWEVNTLLLLIDEELSTTYTRDNTTNLLIETEDLKFTTEELIYTAITRCRNNLIILNFSHNKYHKFFLNQDFEAEFVN